MAASGAARMADWPGPDPLRPADATDGALTAYAGFWRRAVAASIDVAILLLLLVPIILVVVMTFDVRADRLGPGDAVYWLANILITWLYYAGLESGVRQATLGKRLMRLKVTDLDGEPISFGRATARHFAKLVSAAPLMIGFLAAAVTARRQGFHDMIAGCLVVYAPDGAVG
jgi:uncharacterized RDD family membrane protein YckC